MKKIISTVLFAFAILWILHGSALALRCGGKVIQIGDTCDQVRDLCGEPTSVEQRKTAIPIADPLVGVYYGAGQDVITSDVWTYDFGRYRLLYHLIFQDGRLERLETAGYPQ